VFRLILVVDIIKSKVIVLVITMVKQGFQWNYIISRS